MLLPSHAEGPMVGARIRSGLGSAAQHPKRLAVIVRREGANRDCKMRNAERL